MKKNNIYLLLLTLLYSSNFLFGQQIKTYSGKYDLHSYNLSFNVGLLNGTANYTYFEDKDLNRIKDGAFSYNGNFAYNGSLTNITTKGNYLKNNKNGAWSVLCSFSDKTTKGQNTFNGNYKNGYPNGVWTLSYSGQQNGKSGSGKFTLNFIENVVTGIFDHTSNLNSVKGTLDKNGYFDGKTIVKESTDEYVFEFKKGVLISYISRDIQTGKIYGNFKLDSTQIYYLSLLQNIKDSSQLEEIPYRLVDDYNSGTYRLIERLVIKPFYKNFKDYSLFDAFSGDLSIDNGDYNWVGFNCLSMEEMETKSARIKREKLENDAKVERDRLQKIQEEKMLIEKLNSNLVLHTKINENKIDSINLTIYKEFLEKASIVKTKYEIKQQLGEYNFTKTIKKKLYNSHVEICNYYSEQINNENDNSKILVYFQNKINICNKLITLVDVETKELEKTLNKTTDIIEKEKVILNF